MRLIFLLFLFLFFSCKSAKVEENVLAKPDIRATTYLTFLASDDLNGRDTGTPGIEKAASYIEQVFSSSDIKPFFDSYRDPFKVKDLEAFNVVGYIEGNDPDLKDEYILVGAHYDHIGQRAKPVNKDSIANGANDNAAGTVAVLMIAEELKRLNTNKRSIIFALFSAEEMGLQGSKHLSQRLSTLGIDLYTVVNFEMIGVPLIDRDYQAFVSGFRLSNIAAKINEYTGQNLIGESAVARKYDLFKRSDNYPFYLDFMVPSHTISSCDLSNYDYYHHVDDESERMDFDFMSELIEALVPAIGTMANTKTKEIMLYGE